MSPDPNDVRGSGVPSGPRPTLWPALLVGSVSFACALAIATVLRGWEDRALEAVAASALAVSASEIEQRMGDQVRALERFAARWERGGRLPRAEFEAAARELTLDFAYIQAIEWVDPEFRVRWAVPLAGNEAAVGLDLGFESRRRTALEASRDGDSVTAAGPIELVQGGLGFLVYVPLRVAGRPDGFVVGVYRAGALLSALLRNVAPGFDIRVSDSHEAIYTRQTTGATWSQSRRATARVTDQSWSVEVAPGAEILATYQTRAPALVLVGGSLLALGFAIATQLARARRIRSQQLAAEVERRRAAENELSMVVTALPDHVWSGETTEAGFEPGYFSPIIERITGRPAALFRDAPGRWYEFVYPADRERVLRVHRELLKGGRDAFSIEYRILAGDGTQRWVRERVQATTTARGRRLDGVTSDISEIKRAEQERLELEATVQQTQKLESLGVLAGGIAHDFNNLLVGMLGHARIALDELPERARSRQALERVERAAHRAAELCRQMLAYAGQVSIEKEPLDLRAAVEEVGALLSASTSKKIDLVYDFDAHLPWIEADATQIRQVVLNLVTNASEAMGERVGTIRVSAHGESVGRDELDRLEMGRDLEPGRYVVLAVRDEGCGMDEHTRERFMEPFFSTKFSGRGLGLAAVQGIVRRHRGAIDVETELGVGTSIRLLLPASQGPARPPQPSATRPPEALATGTILLIDDDEDARELGTIALERAGYQVVTAIDGIEGVRALEQQPDDIVCVLLDLTMPRLDGAEALRALRGVRGDVPVILCSGYPEAAAVERFAGLGLSAFLAKPYEPDELLRKIGEALTRPEA